MGGAVGREGGGQCLLMSDPVGLVSVPPEWPAAPLSLLNSRASPCAGSLQGLQAPSKPRLGLAPPGSGMRSLAGGGLALAGW